MPYLPCSNAMALNWIFLLEVLHVLSLYLGHHLDDLAEAEGHLAVQELQVVEEVQAL